MKRLCFHRRKGISSVNGMALCLDCGQRVPHPWAAPQSRQYTALRVADREFTTAEKALPMVESNRRL